MKITARGGTDGANIVLFWPDNLPADADATLAEDPMALVESLSDQGKLIWFPCDADGEYTLGIYLEELVPEELLRYCRAEDLIEKLIVRGVGYFGGMEYLFKQDRRLLDRYPGMCEQVMVPEGNYSARVYQTDLPDQVYDSWLITQAGARAKRLWDLHSTVASGSVVGVIATVISLFAIPWSAAFWGIAAVTVTLLATTVGMSRTRWYKQVARAQADFEESFPSYVVILALLPGARDAP